MASNLIRYIFYFLLIILLNNCKWLSWTSDSISWTPDHYVNKSQTYKNVENRKLNWNDFPGEPDNNSRAGAAILWDICYTYDSVYTYAASGQISEGLVGANIKVFAGIGSLSWVDPIARNSYVLNHEQKHYDIAKAYAAKFRKIVPSLKPFPRFNWLGKMDSVRNLIRLNCLSIQKKYDKDTKHGADELYQEKWNKRVDSLLHSIN